MKRIIFVVILFLSCVIFAQSKADSLSIKQQEIQAQLQTINYEVEHREAILKLIQEAKQLQKQYALLEEEKKKLKK